MIGLQLALGLTSKEYLIKSFQVTRSNLNDATIHIGLESGMEMIQDDEHDDDEIFRASQQIILQQHQKI